MRASQRRERSEIKQSSSWSVLICYSKEYSFTGKSSWMRMEAAGKANQLLLCLTSRPNFLSSSAISTTQWHITWSQGWGMSSLPELWHRLRRIYGRSSTKWRNWIQISSIIWRWSTSIFTTICPCLWEILSSKWTMCTQLFLGASAS